MGIEDIGHKKNNMTVAYITNNIAPFRVDLLDELSKYVFSVKLFFCLEVEKNVNPEYVKKRPKIASIYNMKTEGYFKLVREIVKNNVVIFDGYTGGKKILLIITLILFRKPFLISVDGLNTKNKEARVKSIFKKLLLGSAVAILSTNKRTDLLLSKFVNKKKIKRHFFTTITQKDLTNISLLNINKAKIKHSISSNQPIVLYVGKFLKTKGIYELIEISKTTNYHFIFVGGDRVHIAKDLDKKSNNIRFIPYLEKDDILELMSISSVFVLPTYSDVWGLVIVEAIMAGVPVVTTSECNAGVELIKNGINGYIVPPREINLLKDSIVNAIHNLDREVAKKYNKKLMESYTLEHSAKNLISILKILFN